MNAEVLIKYFDHISDAPEAIPRFRQLILDLAVRGKVVEQDLNEEPSSALLKRIQTERAKRVLGSEMKDSRLEQVRSAEKWFEVPASWCWVRLGEITQVLMGQSPPGDTYNKAADGLPLINGPVEFTTGPFGKTVINQYTTAPTNVCEEGDLLLCVRGSTTGRTNIAAFKACIGRGVAAIRPFFADHYVRLYVWRLRASILAMGRGIAFPSISRQQIIELPVPLPPLAEQHRIVAKVEELMALCDRLEEAQKQREARRDRLATASFHHLNNGATGPELQEHARFFINHLAQLTTRFDQIKPLRQTILDLAIRGCLVPQEPNDESAADSLKRIQMERAELVKEGSIRPDKPNSSITLHEIPFTLPESWLWVRIAQASLFTEYGTSHQSVQSESGVPVLRMGDIQDGRVVLGGQKMVPSSIDDLPALYLKKYDLLYNRTNSAELVGKTGIYLGEDLQYTFASYLIRIRFSKISSDPRFFNLALNAPYFRATQIVPHLKQQCGQANVNGTTLKAMLIPFPPLAEQKRIVAKVEQLMTVCDQLEAQLTASRSYGRVLLEAVLHEALAATPIHVEAQAQ